MMGNALVLRADFDAAGLRKLSLKSKDTRQVRRLLALAAVYDGANREEAAKSGGMDRQSLRDWVIAFNARGPEGLHDAKRSGAPPKLDAAGQAKLKEIVAAGPDLEKDGVVRWRCCDLQAVIARDLKVRVSEATVGRLLHRLGYAHVSARPRHPGQNAEAIAAFKKTSKPKSAAR
jgi:transposase